MLVSLNACARPEPLKIAISDSCTNFKKISFAELPSDTVDDIGNKADSVETVDQVIEHNARYGRICPEPTPDD